MVWVIETPHHKEPPMPKQNRTNPTPESIAKSLLSVVGVEVVEEVARACGFTKRVRTVTPVGLVTACVATLGGAKVAWLADILRTFNKMNNESLQYKPFHNQLSKKSFPEFIRLVLERALTLFARKSK